MEKLLKKRFIRTLLIVYFLSYVLHDFFFVNFANAEETIQNTNLVAVIVDKKIYDNSSMETYLKRYATDYIQQKISDSKAIVLPINIDNFKAADIVKMLENMYFDGIKDVPSKLIGLVLVGDIPLPVVEYNTFVYPSIYPYVDFEDQQFVYNADKDFFSYNDNPNAKAEIWHGIIDFKNEDFDKEIGQYEKYFKKLQTYNKDQTDNDPNTQFVATKIRYDDFVATKEYFLADNITNYVNSFLFSEDVGYRRYTNLLLDTLKGENNNAAIEAANEFTNGLQDMIPENPDTDEQAAEDFGSTIKDLMDTFNSLMGEMEDNEENGTTTTTNNNAGGEKPPSKAPTLTLQKMTKEFLKGYETLIGTKYLTRIRDNVKTPARRYQPNADGNLTLSFDSHYNKIAQKDLRIVGDTEKGISPLLIDFNNKLEKSLNDKIEEQKYYMKIPIITSLSTYTYDRMCNGEQKNYKTYYFGKLATEITSPQEFSMYRGTFQNLTGIEDQPINSATKSIGGSYNVFSTQIEANRAYNVNNMKTEIDEYSYYDKNPNEDDEENDDRNYQDTRGKIFINREDDCDSWTVPRVLCGQRKRKKDGGECGIFGSEDDNKQFDGNQTEAPIDYAIRNRGGASPLNVKTDANMSLKVLRDYYLQARKPIYDIAGSKAVKEEIKKGYSYEGYNTYASIIKTSDQAGDFLYPRCIDGEDKAGSINYNDGSEPVPLREKDRFTSHNNADFFQVFSNRATKKEALGPMMMLSREQNGGGGCPDKEFYTYKLIDTRIYNTAPTAEQIGGYSFYKFTGDSHILGFYQGLMPEFAEPKRLLIEKKTEYVGNGQSDATGVVSNLLEIKSIVTTIDNNINSVINFHNNDLGNYLQRLKSLTGGQMTQLANSRKNDIFNESYKTEIKTRSTNTIKGLRSLQEFLSKLNIEIIISKLQSIIDIEKSYQRSVELLTGRKQDITSNLGMLTSLFLALQTEFNTSKILYQSIADVYPMGIEGIDFDNLESNLNTKIGNIKSSLDSKIQAIKEAIPSCDRDGVHYNAHDCGCRSDYYKELCDAIPVLKNQIGDNTKGNRADIYKIVNKIQEYYYDPDHDSNDEALVDASIVIPKIEIKKTVNGATFALTGHRRNFRSAQSGFTTSRFMNGIQQASTLNNSFLTTNEILKTEKVMGMNITTIDRPIDNIRNITFQGIGGSTIKFNYPNLYEVPVYDASGTRLTLMTPTQISQKIKTYLIDKAKEYNALLQTENAKKGAFYGANQDAFTFLGGIDPRAQPNRNYALLNENHFINTIGESNITMLGKLIYYQNITQPEKNPQTNVIDDINENKSAFDVNKKITDVMSKYLSGNNDQGPFITPAYSTGGYEVAFINSDSRDYIKAKPTPTIINDISSIQKPNTYTEIPEQKEAVDEACNFDPSGSELIFDVKKLTSPWLKAMKCWFTETMKDPFKITINYSNAMGPTLNTFPGEVTQEVENRQGSAGQYAGQRGALDTQESNEQTIATSTTREQATLKDINTYTEIRLSNTGRNEATSRQLGNQTIGKQIKIWSNRDLGDLDIKIWATGDNCLNIRNVTSNLCTPYVSSFNPAKSPKNYDIDLKDNKAGTTIITAEFCAKNSNKCIKKAKKIEILADPLVKATFKTTSDEVIAGGEIPFKIQGQDQYGNDLGLVAPEVMLSTQTGDGQIRNGSTISNSLTFSDFKKSELSYLAPSKVPDDMSMKTTIYFSGLSKIGGKLMSITGSHSMTVVKGFLSVYQSGKPTPLFNERQNTSEATPMNISLDGMENTTDTGGKIINKNLIPKILLSLKDKNGLPLTRVKSMALISTQNKLLTPGEVQNDTFTSNGSFIIEGGMLEIYLYPNFKAGNDTLYVSIPGIDTVKVPVIITPGAGKIVNLTIEKEAITSDETAQAKVKVTDIWDNPIHQATTIKIDTIGALTISGDSTPTVTGESTIYLKAKEPGGESYVYATIQNLALNKQTPAYKEILIQNTVLPETGLNIMYLNLFGTDRGNQRGYFSDKNSYVNKLINQSDKLLAVTTQLMNPNKLRSTDVIITQNAQVKNLANKEISLQIIDKNLIIKATDIGTVNIGTMNDFGLEKISDTNTIQKITEKKNLITYLAEETDSIIQTNEVSNKKIIINGQEVINLNDGNIADGVTIKLSDKKTNGFSMREVIAGEQKVGTLMIVRNKDTKILKERESNTQITNTEYGHKEVFADSSTNGDKGIGLYQINSSFKKEGYKSIEDNNDSSLGLGFTSDFKNVTYFGEGKSVGESTLPFSSQFLINFGDPLLQKVSKNIAIENTKFDGGLGDPVYSDPNKTIFKVLPIDFNDDGLQDLLITYQDGTIRLMKNYGGNTPYAKAQDLMVIADSIKEVVVGDIDGNKFPDIMIRTNNNKLKVYKNNKGIFSVDGSLVCLNTNTKEGEINKTPDDMSKINQVFFEDMDGDEKLDIITNDHRNDIKIFYGGGNNNGEYYLSKLDYTCDTGRYNRQAEHMKLVKNFGIIVNTGYIQDTSIIHRKGLLNTGTVETSTQTPTTTAPTNAAQFTKPVEDMSDEEVDQMLENMDQSLQTDINGSKNQVSQFSDNMGNMVNQRATNARIREIPNPFTTRPEYEGSDGEIMYIAGKDLTTGDTIQVYKTYEDLNGDVLEVGDVIKVRTTILPRTITQYTYAEDAKGMGNTEIATDTQGRFTSFKFTSPTNTGNIKINREPETENDFIIETKQATNERIEFSYEMIYMGGKNAVQIKVEDKEILTNDLPYHYRIETNNGTITTGSISGKIKDGLPDIVAYPNNSCLKYSVLIMNTDQGDRKEYEDIFFNTQAQIDKKAKELETKTQDYLSNTTNEITQTGNIEDTSQMSQILESRNTQDMLGSLMQGQEIGANFNMSAIDNATKELQQEMDTALNGACAGFKLSEGGSCQGNPYAVFNQAFLAPGEYHIMGCLTEPLKGLTETLGKGVPVLTFPSNMPFPLAPGGFVPFLGIFGAPFKGPTDTFRPITTAGPYSSQVRIYVAPTLTLGMGIAICVGPQATADKLPKPFRDIAGNCVVIAIPPGTQCEDTSNLGGGSDQILPSFRVDDPRGACTNPPRKGNTLTFQPDTSSITSKPTSGSPFGIGMNKPGVEPNTDGNFFGFIELDKKPIKINDPAVVNGVGGATSLATTFDFGGGEKFTLEAGDEINLKQLGAASKGIIKCIVKDRVDKQIMFVLTNMTKLTVNVSLPDITQLVQGRDKLSYDRLKILLENENQEDVQAGYTQSTKTATGANQMSTKKLFQNASNLTSNPFDAIMLMFKEVPLINMNTKDIDIKIPMIASEDITKYIAYLKTRYETNVKILDRRISLVNNVLAFCGRTSKEDAPGEIRNLEAELKVINESKDISTNNKSAYITTINKEIRDINDILSLTGDTTWKRFGNELSELGNNLNLTRTKVKQLPRLNAQKARLESKKFGSGITSKFTNEDEALLKIVNARLDKGNKCGNFVGGLGKFLTFYENTAGLIQSIKQNIQVLELYKKFPLQLYERLHITDRYLTEITSVFSDFLGSIMYWMKTNADRFSKYVDALILIMGVIKIRQVLIDFSVNRTKKCGTCTNDDYSPQSCSLGFLCPKIPVLKIPNFRIPNLYIDLSHINLGIDITLPNFNFKPINITLPQIPNLPDTPNFEIFLEYDYGMDLDMGFFQDLSLPTIPILPSPPQLPELPSFIPNIKVQLPVLPPAPRVPKISSKIEISLKIAEFLAKIFCIIKGSVGLVGEQGVKGKIEQLTQRTWTIPSVDNLDLTAARKETPMEGFDYQLDAYLELKYNFDGFYSFLNNIVEPINSLSNFVEGTTQQALDEAQSKMNDNAITDAFSDIENFQIEDLNSYIPKDEDKMLEYTYAYPDVQKGIQAFQIKANEQNDIKTAQALTDIKTDIQTKSNIRPAITQLENAGLQAQKIINNKQKETQKLTEQIHTDYDGFIKSLKGKSNTLVKEENISATISAPLFTTDTKILTFLQKQDNPNEEYVKLNKKVIDGYVKALDTKTPAELNMSATTYEKSKAYLEDINNKIEQASPLFATREGTALQTSTSNSSTSKVLLAQSTCTTCGNEGSTASPISSDASSVDLSQFVKGIFTEAYNGSGEKQMVNVVKSEQNIEKIGKNYIQTNINNDSTTTIDNSDIIMRDEKTIYIKYANQNNQYGETKNGNTNFYVHSIESPDELRNDDKTEPLNDGYIDIEAAGFLNLNKITVKLADESWEVKNFKMQGQDFESISFARKNSGIMGDKPDGYLIKLNQRIDTFNDKDESSAYELEEEEIHKKYILVLPEGTDTGGLISLKDGFSDKKPIKSLMTGDIIETKFYDPTQEKINITLLEIPRTRQYAQIATITKHQEKLSTAQAEKFGLYEITSPWSNQIMAGRQLIGDSKGPEGEFTRYRPQVNEIVDTGTSFDEGFVSTHYTIQANRKDNVAVQAMRIEKNDEIIAFQSGYIQTGYIELPGLFYTGEKKDTRFFGAQDFNGNVSREQINITVKIPEISIIETKQINEESAQIIAELSNDVDEGNVSFQRQRNDIRKIISGTNGTSYFGLTGRQTIVTGGIFSIGNTIGFFNVQGKEVGTLNPKNGRILINSGFQSTIKTQLDFTSHMPLIKIFDTTIGSTIFQVNLPTESISDIMMHQGAPKYTKTLLDGTNFGAFNGGYCIKGQDNNCMIFLGPEGQIYLPTPYNNSLIGTYEFETSTSNILYHIKDQNNNLITIISLKFKPQQ